MATNDKAERIKNIIDFVQTSRLIDTKQPIDGLLGSVKTLIGTTSDAVAAGGGGTQDYVLAWERYVLVVAAETA